jgi:hypothetical protein
MWFITQSRPAANSAAVVLRMTADSAHRALQRSSQGFAVSVIVHTYPSQLFPSEVLKMCASDQARALMHRHHHLVKHRQQSLLSRSAAEVGLPAEAANYWNHIQGKPHPSFRASYDRSAASLS